MEKIFEQFGINPILLAAQIVNFLVLLFILNKLLYKPLLNVLQKRKETIAQSLKNAEEIERKLAETAKEEEKRIMKAALEGEKIIKQAQDMAVQIIEEGKQDAQSLAEKIIEEGKSQIQLEREKLTGELRQHLSEFVMIAMEKVSGKAFDRVSQKKLVDDAVKSL